MCLSNKTLTNINKRLLLLTIVLLAGSTVYIVGLFILNICIPAEHTSYFTSNGTPLLEIRLMVRRIEEIIYDICAIIYLIGTIIVLRRSIKSEFAIKFKQLFLFSIGTITALFLSAIPFILMDRTFAFDYLFPFLSMLGYILLIFSITGIVNLKKSKRA